MIDQKRITHEELMERTGPQASRVLRTYELDVVIEFFCHYMGQEQRAQLRREFPVIYEKLMATYKLF